MHLASNEAALCWKVDLAWRWDYVNVDLILIENRLSVPCFSACSFINQLALISPVLRDNQQSEANHWLLIFSTVFQMSEAVEDVKKNNKVRSVIVCSLVPGVFCAGVLPLSFQTYANLPFSQMMMIIVMQALEKVIGFWIVLFFSYLQVRTWRREPRCSQVKLGLLCPKQDLSSLS